MTTGTVEAEKPQSIEGTVHQRKLYYKSLLKKAKKQNKSYKRPIYPQQTPYTCSYYHIVFSVCHVYSKPVFLCSSTASVAQATSSAAVIGEVAQIHHSGITVIVNLNLLKTQNKLLQYLFSLFING